MSRAMGTRSLIAEKGICRSMGLNQQIHRRSGHSAVSHLLFRTSTTALPGLGTSPTGGAIPGQRSTANRSIQRGSPHLLALVWWESKERKRRENQLM